MTIAAPKKHPAPLSIFQNKNRISFHLLRKTFSWCTPVLLCQHAPVGISHTGKPKLILLHLLLERGKIHTYSKAPEPLLSYFPQKCRIIKKKCRDCEICPPCPLQKICLNNTFRRNLISCHHSVIKWSNLYVCEAQIVITAFTHYHKRCLHQFYSKKEREVHLFTFFLRVTLRNQSCVCALSTELE